ncbi:MAG: glycoside hydrolase family 88 protein, partial [Bacteroidales bacterium]|nr:glycoside hydrolase family 88 protein [Bacteroidales bacterium]
MKLYFTILIIAFIFGCSQQNETNEKGKYLSWALKFSDAVMYRSDSLIYYDREIPKYEYDYAFLASAIGKLGQYDKKYSDYAQAYIDYFVQDDGSISTYKKSNFNIDRVRPGLNMLYLYERTGEEKYKKAAETLVSQMEEHPRTKTNGFWHKKAYPWQMWLDGLYMASPFLVKYAEMFDEPKWFDEVTFQLQLVYEKTLDEKTGLLYHAWDESREQKWCNPETG